MPRLPVNIPQEAERGPATHPSSSTYAATHIATSQGMQKFLRRAGVRERRNNLGVHSVLVFYFWQ